MTTSPGRIRLFQPVIEAVFRQSVSPDQIHLHLPDRFRGETEYEIPGWLQDEARISLHRHTQDRGPAMKLLPTLDLEKAADTIIITLDDDVRMPTDAIEVFAKAAEEHPDTAFCSRGFNFNRDSHHIEPVRGHHQQCDALQGYSGCCYRRGHFDHQSLLSQLNSIPAIFRFSDDILLSNHIAGRNVKRATVSFESGSLEFMPWSDEDPDALKFIEGSTHGRYQALREHLDETDEWRLT